MFDFCFGFFEDNRCSSPPTIMSLHLVSLSHSFFFFFFLVLLAKTLSIMLNSNNNIGYSYLISNSYGTTLNIN